MLFSLECFGQNIQLTIRNFRVHHNILCGDNETDGRKCIKYSKIYSEFGCLCEFYLNDNKFIFELVASALAENKISPKIFQQINVHNYLKS